MGKRKPGVPTYGAVHARIHVQNGPAAAYKCAECGEKAREWAYDGTDPNELRGDAGHGYALKYSEDLTRYRPMCRKCHHREDSRLKRTTCPAGHEYSYTYIQPNGAKARVCRKCVADNQRRRREGRAKSRWV